MKYNNIKNKLLTVFDNARNRLPMKLYSSPSEEFFVYKGYRLSKDSTDYIEIVDVRNSDFFKPIPDSQINQLLEVGFERFCNERRVEVCEKAIDRVTRRIERNISCGESVTALKESRIDIAKEIRILINKKY